jgi:protein-disulfide isomerase
MRQIWLTFAALCVVAPVLAAPLPALAQSAGPVVTPQDHMLGKADAPITIVEYASLTCPHCAEFDKSTLPDIKKNWIETGKAKLVFRDFPLDRVALRAAMAARCAPPDRYFAFVDTLFQTQLTWERGDNPDEELGKIAKLGGVSDEQFKKCMADDKLADAVTASRFSAEKEYGIDSTPTFFINGVKMDPNGAQPYEVFDKVLTAALPKS